MGIKVVFKKLITHSYEYDLWRKKTELLNLRLSKLARAKVLLQMEFDTKDQVLFPLL